MLHQIIGDFNRHLMEGLTFRRLVWDLLAICLIALQNYTDVSGAKFTIIKKTTLNKWDFLYKYIMCWIHAFGLTSTSLVFWHSIPLVLIPTIQLFLPSLCFSISYNSRPHTPKSQVLYVYRHGGYILHSTNHMLPSSGVLYRIKTSIHPVGSLYIETLVSAPLFE